MFKLEISTDNAAFEDHMEIPHILRGLAAMFEESRAVSGGVFDSNGNRVGSFNFDGDGATPTDRRRRLLDSIRSSSS